MKITGNEPVSPTMWDDKHQPLFIRDNDGLTFKQHMVVEFTKAFISARSAESVAGSIDGKYYQEHYVVKDAISYADEVIKQLNDEA